MLTLFYRMTTSLDMDSALTINSEFLNKKRSVGSEI